MRKQIILSLALCLSLGSASGCFKAESKPKPGSEKKVRKYQGYTPAPEFPKNLDWLNTSAPISLKELKGKFVVLDFWTYACINCMHILPDLHRLEEKYKNELVVIGVHSAKFNNEKETDNIRKAILRYEISHPVINDKDFRVWNEYGAQAWPTLIVINPEGKIIEQYIGEGFYKDLDLKLSEAIREADEYKLVNRAPFKPLLEKAKVKASMLSFPGKVFADEKSNNLFISDSNHNRVVIADLQTGKIKQVIGSGKAGLKDGDFRSAAFNRPQGIYLKDNTLYIADTENHALRKADLTAKTVETVAGNGTQAPWGTRGGIARDTMLNSPWDLTGHNDDLFIAMAGSHQIWKYSLSSGIIENFAGSGRENIYDGLRTMANLAQPSGITTDGKNLYFADSEVSAVRLVELEGIGQVKTIVGTGLFDFGDKDGSGREVRLQHPLGVAGYQGKIFVADTYNHKIKIIDPREKEAKTFLGSGRPGSRNGKGISALLNEPGGLSAAGNKLYIADTNNNLVRVADIKSGELTTLEIGF